MGCRGLASTRGFRLKEPKFPDQEQPVPDKTPMPDLPSFGDVVRWVIDELGAMCPSLERLQAYRRMPEAPALRDVRYHVEEASCRLCRADLQDRGAGRDL